MTFNFGANPVTITVTSQMIIGMDMTIDGGGLIAISGGGQVPLLLNEGTLTLANLTIPTATAAAVAAAPSTIGIIPTASMV